LTLSIIKNETLQDAFTLSVIMLTAFVQKPIYDECRYAECRYAECRYAECRYAECRYAEGRYPEGRYAECRGVDHNGGLLLFLPTSD
jgi:hypothetical protein